HRDLAGRAGRPDGHPLPGSAGPGQVGAAGRGVAAAAGPGRDRRPAAVRGGDRGVRGPRRAGQGVRPGGDRRQRGAGDRPGPQQLRRRLRPLRAGRGRLVRRRHAGQPERLGRDQGPLREAGRPADRRGHLLLPRPGGPGRLAAGRGVLQLVAQYRRVRAV
ncbi:MAG: hypothetical protein AVDCRST_MAG41-1719, partial [uncultured Corynebacteriales bacterium]